MSLTLSPRKIFNIIKFHCKQSNERYVIHNCSQCEYPCCFYWENEQLMFDGGCWCLVEKVPPKPMNDDEFISYIRKNPEIVERKLKEMKIILGS